MQSVPLLESGSTFTKNNINELVTFIQGLRIPFRQILEEVPLGTCYEL